MRLPLHVKLRNTVAIMLLIPVFLQSCTPSYSLRDYKSLPERVENKEEDQSKFEAAIPDYIDRELVFVEKSI